jgi:hypothetical protein
MSLSDEGIRGAYATSCCKLWKNFGTANLEDVKKGLIVAANTALVTSGVPKLEYGLELGGGNMGAFYFTTWKLMFGGALVVTDRTSDIFIEMVDTVYHESRHCEQWFRIAQALAAGTIKRPLMMTVAIPAKGDSASIATFMAIELRIAQKAVENAKLQVALSLVQEWFRSIYGSGSKPRENRLADNDRYEDYRKLPEEQDAWPQGEKAGEAVRVALDLKYPNLYDWKLLTRLDWHIRCGLLVDVDKALETYQSSRNDGNRTKLKDAFDKWYKDKPDDAKARNKAECVTKLRDWLAKSKGEQMGGFKLV